MGATRFGCQGSRCVNIREIIFTLFLFFLVHWDVFDFVDCISAQPLDPHVPVMIINQWNLLFWIQLLLIFFNVMFNAIPFFEIRVYLIGVQRKSKTMKLESRTWRRWLFVMAWGLALQLLNVSLSPRRKPHLHVYLSNIPVVSFQLHVLVSLCLNFKMRFTFRL